jgi:dihydrofolate synthase / folylpolyglutamate synthase
MKRLEEALSRFGIMPGLERTQKICETLGRPQERLEVILVTGTNGKGSVAAALASILTEAGHKTGSFFSPHVERYNERFVIDRKEITDAEFGQYEDTLLLLHEQGYEMTVFEALTAIAYKYFADNGCRFAVMEIGMGGRFDATNIATERAAIVSNVGLEHTDYLGKSVREIAADKANIIKNPKGVAVTACDGEALEEVRKRAAEVGVRVLALGEEGGIGVTLREARADSTVFDYSGKGKFQALVVSLAGRHQAKNAALAVAVAEELGAGEAAIRAGLAKVRHPGRLQVIGRAPLVVADGAHNPEGMMTLVASLDLFPRDKLVCVFSALKDKDWRSMLAIVGPLCDSMVINQIPGERAADPKEIAEEASRHTKAEVVTDITKSFLLAKRKAGKNGMVLICGSLYMLGEAMAAARGYGPGFKSNQ